MPTNRRHTTPIRKLAAIMFTDIVGYTSLMGKDEDKAVDMLTKNHAIHKVSIEKFKGTLIKEIGDGILASFSLASEAVRCAIEIQNACMEQEIPLKIGIHEGETIFARGDVLGDTVNIAARLLETSKEGCIFVSDTVYKNIKNKADIQVKFVEERTLKNVDELLKIYNVSCKALTSKTIKPTHPEPAPEKKKSIIVLPFDDMSPESDQEYFSDGLTEEIITDLSYIHDLLVISRNSSMTFKGTKKKTTEIAQEVNVRYVLEGSVRKAGNNLRIIAQLIDAITDTHIWAEKYSGTLDDIFDIQEKVSREIADALKLKLSSVETKNIVKQQINNARAYDYYLKGRSAYSVLTEDGLDQARRYYEEGLKITGDNALLYAAMGEVYAAYVQIWAKQEDALEKAEEYAHKALELDPETAQAYTVLAMCQYYRGITKDMVRLFKKGYSIDPNDLVRIHYLGWGYIMIGRTSEALPLAQQIIELDPINPIGYFLGVVHFYLGKFKETVEVIEKFWPSSALLDIPYVRMYKALFLVYAGKINQALNVLEPFERTSSSDLYSQFGRLLRFALQEKKNQIRKLMTKEFIFEVKKGGAESCWAASFFALLGDFEASLDWLENAVNRGFINYPFMSQHDPFLTKMRGNPRYDKLMERVKREWESFEF